jgi:hypothetical protein
VHTIILFVTSLPEPNTLVLMGASLILAALVLRKLFAALDQRQADAAKQSAQK